MGGNPSSGEPGVRASSSTSRVTKRTSPAWFGKSAPVVPPGASRFDNGKHGAATTNPAATQWSYSPAQFVVVPPYPVANTTSGSALPVECAGSTGYDTSVGSVRFGAPGYEPF